MRSKELLTADSTVVYPPVRATGARADSTRWRKAFLAFELFGTTSLTT
jgi:hypothetical protein